MDKAIVKHESEAWGRYRRIVELKRQIEKNFLDIGQELYEFQRLGQWKLNWPSFNSFLADPDVNISKRHAYRLIRVWREYAIGLNVQSEELIAIGGTKLEMMASYVDEKNIDKMLNMAATLSRSDLKAELTGVEQVYIPVQWESLLHEARNACELLARSDAPDEVRAFALDFWSATSARV